jgi:uncharacterized membrane protein YhhN
MLSTLIWAALALGALWLPFSHRADSHLRSALKTMPCLVLALAAWIGGASLLAVALVFSALADLMLSRPGKPMFRRGMELFAAAHLAYIVIFGTPLDGIASYPLASAVLILVALSSEAWLIPKTGRLAWYVRLYVAVIAAMGLAAFGLGQPTVIVGAGLFILSDLLLAARKFVLEETHPRAPVLGWAVWTFYVLGQALITAGLLRLA